MVGVGFAMVGLSVVVTVYGLYLRRLCSTVEVAREIQYRVMRGDHLGSFHLKPAHDVAVLMLSRESRSRICLIGGSVGLVVGGVVTIIGLLR